MSSSLPHLSFVDLSAPRESGGVLIEPEFSFAGDMAVLNRQCIAAADYDIQGRSLAELADEARRQVIAAAIRYTRSYRDVDIPALTGTEPVFLAGHQPEMFHPGVWLKNFVLHRIAEKFGGVAINLQIDSDAAKSASIRVPCGSAEQPRIDAVAFDRAAGGVPWEQWTITKRDCFSSFGQRVVERIRPLVGTPFMERYWPLVTQRSMECDNVGACLAQARHKIEGGWGLETLEVPQSRVCDLPAVQWFVIHLLAHMPRLWETYNSALAVYRREHKVRSAAHPAPDLHADVQWLETPFWVWSADDPVRRPLFVRQRNDELCLTDRHGWDARLSVSPESDAGRAVEQLADLARRGIRIRTRALITTLAARLLLGDLFLHGIGGAKYDRLTDRILAQFFGIEPPGYMVVSGTLRLPIRHTWPKRQEWVDLKNRIRELEFHPERFVSSDGAMARWIEEKRRWIESPPTPNGARERTHGIRRANQAMQPAVAALRESWKQEADRLDRALRNQLLLSSREYAFPLFPEVVLTKFFS